MGNFTMGNFNSTNYNISTSSIPTPSVEQHIHCGDIITYETTTPGDIHYYSFDLFDNGSNGNGYNIFIDTCGSEFDTIAYLFEEIGSNIHEFDSCDDCGWCGTSSQLQVDSMTAGEYMVAVAGFGSHYGRYRFELTCTNMDDYNYSPTNAPSSRDSIDSTFYGLWSAFERFDAYGDPDATGDEQFAFISAYYFEWWNTWQYTSSSEWIVVEPQEFYLDESEKIRVQLMQASNPAVIKITFKYREPNPFIYYTTDAADINNVNYEISEEDQALIDGEKKFKLMIVVIVGVAILISCVLCCLVIRCCCRRRSSNNAQPQPVPVMNPQQPQQVMYVQQQPMQMQTGGVPMQVQNGVQMQVGYQAYAPQGYPQPVPSAPVVPQAAFVQQQPVNNGMANFYYEGQAATK